MVSGVEPRSWLNIILRCQSHRPVGHQRQTMAITDHQEQRSGARVELCFDA